ncbi:N-acetylmuramoyl-L-alanine amidase [Pantoea sp. Aalb]|uniref:N-acetylmuramoyl-L-alanine amidase n=1 Tax=Pantoea sp. Aalb TaxID=2576762 RepID=UPI00132BB42A|nr:N-acetylmuramoyl-L-alanine amidase [Pantoea sp. Aalb]MXP67674.1 N-acetylmuramoyl-L-alanine amidase AmiB [Pantoea sp. Aalb]
MISQIKIFSIIVFCIFSTPILSATLFDIQVKNSTNIAIITLRFKGKPVYSIFPCHNHNCFLLKMRQSGIFKELPLNFSGKNMLKRINSIKLKNKQLIHLLFKLTRKVNIHTNMIQFDKDQYRVVISILNMNHVKKTPIFMKFSHNNKKIINSNANINHEVIIVAIDAGHGGQDPGALGQHGLHEKNVTIAIAKKLKALMDKDNMFKSVLTRNSDHFISVMNRSEVARKKNANLLISLHADAAPNHAVTGASIWLLSKRRANSEMANWLEQKEKQSELLGGTADILTHNRTDPYLSQAMLDLQFIYSQRIGYEVALKVLQQLNGIVRLHKRLPEYASLGVLRSPDIPSLLIETGFISNVKEERLLGSNTYQRKIALSIYKGIRSYFLAHPLKSTLKQQRNLMVNKLIKGNVAKHFQLSTNIISPYNKTMHFYPKVRSDLLTTITMRYVMNPQLYHMN